MSKKTNLIVQIQWIKGNVAAYDKGGNLQNENGKTKLTYGTLEWRNYLSKLITHGYCEVEAVAAFELVKAGMEAEYDKVDVPDYVVAEIAKAMEGAKPVLTADQQRIVDLEAKLEAFMNGGKPKKEAKPKAKDNTPNINEELEAAREEYTKVIGKKPSHLMKLANINKAIEEENNK